MRFEDVSFRYQRRTPWVLRDVTFSLAPSRITEVTGHNGAGKSTLLRLIAGLLSPRQGNITGRPAKVGYAPERFPTDQPFTVRSYLTHMAAMQRASRRAINDWAERLGFPDLLDTRLAELSKGTAQKVGLTQALLASSELLVLDEPFAGLDTTTQKTLQTALLELTTQGTTIAISDHQGTMSNTPAITQLQIKNTTIKPIPKETPNPNQPSEPAQKPATATPDTWTVLEILVRPEEQDEVTAKLRADGLNVRTPKTPNP